MRKLVLLNNRGTTLTGALAIGATSFNISLLTTDIIGGVFGATVSEYKLVATITDDVNLEIIAITGVSGSTVSIERGIESTSAQAWAAGAKLEFRLTAGMLNELVQVTKLGRDFSDLERQVAEAVQANALWTANVATPAIALLKSGADFTYALINFNTGKLAGFAEPVVPEPGATVGDGDTYWWALPLLPSGAIDFTYIGQRLANIGDNSTPVGMDSLTLGRANRAIGDSARVIGANSKNYGAFSTIMGDNLLNFGRFSVVMAPENQFVSGQNVNDGFVIDCIPSKPNGLSLFDTPDTRYQSSAEGVIWAPPMDFCGGPAWTANTQMRQGSIRRPTVANGFQYLRYDNNFKDYNARNDAFYPFGFTGVSQPVWPTVQNDIVVDGQGYWVCLPNVGMRLTFGVPFIPKEIGIIIHQLISVTVQPFVSVGKSGSNALFKANGQTTLLNSVNKVNLFSVTTPEATTALTFSINTLGTGTLMIGQFFVRGQLCPSYWQ